MMSKGPVRSAQASASQANQGVSLVSSSPVSGSASPSCDSPMLLASDCLPSLPWQWPQDIVAKSPSVEDGMTHKKVLENKHHAFVFIEEMRRGIKFQTIISSTAMVLFNRFYRYQSMTHFKWKEMAWCCLFAAFKIEEKVMKMESLLKWSHHISCKLKRMSPEEMERHKLDVNGQAYFEMKERLQFNERVLLQTIGFDMDIKQVGFMVIALLRTLRQRAPSYTALWAREVGKVAFEWAAVSAGSELCLLFKPEVIAAGLIYGAAHDYDESHKTSSMKAGYLPNGERMWDLFHPLIPQGDVTERLLHGIMTRFFTYCKDFKEPRAFFRSQSAAGAASAAPDAKATIGPPKDPTRYDPLRVPMGTSVGSPLATGLMSTAPMGGSGAAPVVSPVAGVDVKPSSNMLKRVSPAAAVAMVSPAVDTPSPRLTGSVSHSGTSTASAQPSLRTATNTQPEPLSSVVPTSAMATDCGVPAASQTAVAQAVAPSGLTSSGTELHRPEKRPLTEVVPPGGGDGSMKDEAVSWPDQPAAKRIRQDGLNHVQRHPPKPYD